MDKIQFLGTMFRTTTDKEGESKVQFCVPQSDLLQVMKVSACTETLLKITVEVAAQGVQLNDSSAA